MATTKKKPHYVPQVAVDIDPAGKPVIAVYTSGLKLTNYLTPEQARAYVNELAVLFGMAVGRIYRAAETGEALKTGLITTQDLDGKEGR